MNQEHNDEILEHYGVKGMRWGVRRAVTKANRATKNIKADSRAYSKDKAKAALANKVLGNATSKIRIRASEAIRRNVGQNADSIADRTNKQALKGAVAIAKQQKKNNKQADGFSKELTKAKKAGDVTRAANAQARLAEISKGNKELAAASKKLAAATRAAERSNKAITDSRKQYLEKLSKNVFGNVKNVKQMENMVLTATKDSSDKKNQNGNKKKVDTGKIMKNLEKGMQLYGKYSHNKAAKTVAEAMEQARQSQAQADEATNTAKKMYESNVNLRKKVQETEKINENLRNNANDWAYERVRRESAEKLNEYMKKRGMYESNNQPRRDVTPNQKRLETKHGDDMNDEILHGIYDDMIEHYGIKGMKWKNKKGNEKYTVDDQGNIVKVETSVENAPTTAGTVKQMKDSKSHYEQDYLVKNQRKVTDINKSHPGFVSRASIGYQVDRAKADIKSAINQRLNGRKQASSQKKKDIAKATKRYAERAIKNNPNEGWTRKYGEAYGVAVKNIGKKRLVKGKLGK
jgi:hypothetical protein